MTKMPAAHQRVQVLVVSDGKHGATATQEISFLRPFQHGGPHEISIGIEQDHSSVAKINEAFASQQPDVLILSRFTSARGRDWVTLARAAGIPVIFHIDDDLLDVPESLGVAKFQAYNDPARLRALRNNIACSDLVYASTDELGRRFASRGLKPPVIAGDVYCSVDPDQIGASIGQATGPVIGYMGTSGHAADLAMILPAIQTVLDSIPELHFETFGTIRPPATLERFGSRVRHLSGVQGYSAFLKRLKSLGWWIGLAPLEDNSFNRCKADTKWVEYSLADMAVIASDLPVYHRACADGSGLVANGYEEWTAAILKLLHEPQSRLAMIESAKAKLRRDYSHDRLRTQIAEIIANAIDSNPINRVAGCETGRLSRRPAR
jgi:glycosyltransferase involved in cell wall biosynthesis